MSEAAINFHLAAIEKAARAGEETEQSIRSRQILRKVGIFAI